MTQYTPPAEKYLKRSLHAFRSYFNPIFFNIEKLDFTRPALLVGNHTLYAIDVPLLIHELRQQKQIHVRSLGDRVHLEVPLWRDFLRYAGMLEGTPENCHDLMGRGESILVFPGGSREVMRRKDDGYTLFWKNRCGFARMAIEHGYDIIPFASIGANESFDIHWDAHDIERHPVTQFLIQNLKLEHRVRGGDLFIPFVTGLGPSLIPRPERFYFSFAERICTENIEASECNIWQIREQTRSAVEQHITHLLNYRERDRTENWSWIRRKLTSKISK